MNLRSLPRVFLAGVDVAQPIDLPEHELQKLRKVLRLSDGDELAVLPNDGSLVRCVLDGRCANPLEVTRPITESPIRLTVAQALPKGDKLEEIVRACTEIGASSFLLFESDRTIVSWDEKKVSEKLSRLNTIAREACEVSFRTRLPEIHWVKSLRVVLDVQPDAIVLSEREGTSKRLLRSGKDACIVVGPEGGWSPNEIEEIADRGTTLGPRVLRVEHAAAAAAAILLLT